jgi:glycerophosphoryl diester phosphodiesterase
MDHFIPTKQHPVKIIAHRGDSSEAPENTMAAFKKAIALGVDYLECDVQLSKDRVPVVIHDKTFLRITAGLKEHDVDQLTIKEIKELDAGSWFDFKFKGERIPTLEELLLLQRGNTGLMVEVKEETFFECDLAHFVGEVIKKVAPNQHEQGEILIGSLNPEILLCFHAYLPEQKLIGVAENEKKLQQFLKNPLSHLALHFSIADPTCIQELQDKGIKVWSWTVDEKSTALQLIHYGIDGLITNTPKKMKALHVASKLTKIIS